MTAAYQFSAMSNQSGCCTSFAAPCTSAHIFAVMDTVLLTVSIIILAVLL